MQNSDPHTIEIIQKIIKGDANAFEQIIKEYEKRVLNIIKKHVPYDQIEELAQETFIRVYKSLSSFKQKSSFKQWVSAIAVRTCYDFWRKRYRSREITMSSLNDGHIEYLEKTIADESFLTFENEGHTKEASELLKWALDKLSPEDRMVVELIYLEELSVKEAANLLGWSIANVKIRSFRIRKKLSKLLSGLI